LLHKSRGFVSQFDLGSFRGALVTEVARAALGREQHAAK
jgi:hypothetical protein